MQCLKVGDCNCYLPEAFEKKTLKNSFSTKEDPVQLIIDSRKFSNLFDNSDIILQIEKHSRNLCYELYNKRLTLLRNLEDGFPGGAP